MTVLHSYLQIIADNAVENVIKTVEVCAANDQNKLSVTLSNILKELQLGISLETVFLHSLPKSQLNEIKLILGNNILNNNKVCY